MAKVAKFGGIEAYTAMGLPQGLLAPTYELYNLIHMVSITTAHEYGIA